MSKKNKILESVLPNSSQSNRVYTVDKVSKTLTGSQGGSGVQTGYYAVPKQIVSGSQGNRVYDSEGTSVTLNSDSGGLGAKTGLYAVPKNDPKIKVIHKGNHQWSYVYDSEGIARALQAGENSGTVEVKTGLYAIPKDEREIKTIIKGDHQHEMVQDSEGISRTLAARDWKDAQRVAIPKPVIVGKYSHEHINNNNGTTRSLLSHDSHGPQNVAVPCIAPDRVTKSQNGRRFKDPEDPMFTLTAQDQHGVLLYNDKEYYIRKLTPKECFRLQGFSDEDFEKASAVNSNTQLYKQAGNAVTTNVVYEFGKYIMECERAYRSDQECQK